MGLGMFFHKFAPPRPPKPDFYREIPSTISGRPGKIILYFYVPKDYNVQKRLWGDWSARDEPQEEAELANEQSEDSSEESLGKSPARQDQRISTSNNAGRFTRRLSVRRRQWGGYPVVVNFHGGGFTLGSATDDARWCGTVVDECHAVVVSVDYRLAPEHPFPTAVEDGVDALLYLHANADQLGIDKDKIALSGFSSGANMAFTVPLRLYDELNEFPRDNAPYVSSTDHQADERALHGAAPPEAIPANEDSGTSSNPAKAADHTVEFNRPNDSVPHAVSAKTDSKLGTVQTVTEEALREVKIRMIVPWYPPVDYTRTREQRRATGSRPDQELPALFTNLFDDSYLHPPKSISLDSPYLSPGVAPSSLLRNALPNEIIMHTCEWDMLLDEGRAFKDRLEGSDIDKKVWYSMVEGVPHGWDKAPNPLRPTPGVREHYLRACKEMRRVFGPEKGARPPMERATTQGFPTVARRDSIAVVR